ncbi:universal stress protein [Acinetobacter qingfengensis]|uniref:Universal stress protein n=1 Tax=Acinetobacter qingfengensis TaxID=1262585 RepID=A0A1E7QWK1_9GAMM|nr:universal stress protein [Acinetobacter qingfengensis]KAA8731278.1 universal stress protein [Acinetobacter qingfengensis]OEY91475.1 universal stress protein [Acinetobacter qingfengensis]
MSFQHILVPIDGSTTSYAAVSKAAELAKAFDSKVTAICVLSLDPFFGVEFINTQDMLETAVKQAHEEVARILTEAKQKFAEYGLVVDTKVIEGNEINKAIVEAAKELQTDLVVIGSHGRKGLKKFVLGSVAQSILGEISVPVLVVRE